MIPWSRLRVKMTWVVDLRTWGATSRSLPKGVSFRERPGRNRPCDVASNCTRVFDRPPAVLAPLYGRLAGHTRTAKR